MKFDVIVDSADHISKEAINHSAASLIPERSVLIVVRSGILARTIPIGIAGKELTINQDLKALCPRNGLKRLSEVSNEFGRGKSKHRPRNDPKLYGGEYPFIQTGDIRNSAHLISSYTQTYNKVGLSQSKLWPAGTVCITIAANIAETGILTFDACFPDSVIGVVTNKSIANNKFLEYQLESFKTRLQALGKGSAQDNINMGTFENQLFSFPSLETQIKIVSTLDALREETQRLESIYRQKLAALEALKKSLLHEAFRGQL
jgi:type I restriction enzyme S subunit